MRRLSLVLVLVVAGLGSLWAQRTITGTVTDQDGDPLIGASILVKGTSTGTVSDIDGNFQVVVPEGAGTLIISYTGFETQTYDLGSSDQVDISLTEGVSLQDVIVVGYTAVERKDITGSVASVDGESLAAEAGVTVQSALRGRAPGVTVLQSSGTPGSAMNVRVRGATSVSASNSPLYVVDGVPVIEGSFSQVGVGGQGANALADLNPADIESIEVLKDASSASIYGSRGANGVVLITTKKGKAGKTQVNFNASYGIQEAIKLIPIVDSAGYRGYLNEAYGNPNFLAGGLQGNSDWQNLIFDQGTVEDYSLNVSGGNQKTRFYGSLAFFENEGILQGSRFTRYSGRLNVDHRASDKFTFGMNFNYNYTDNKRVQNDNNIYGAISTAILLPPTVPIRNADGSYGSAFGLENPVAAVTEYENFITTNRLIGNVFGQYSILPSLSIKASLGVDILDLREDVFQPSVLQSTANGEKNVGTTRNFRWVQEYTINWIESFGRSRFNVLGGVGFQEDRINQSFSTVADFPTDNFTALDAGASPITIAGDFSGDILHSYFANARYAFDDRYIITLSFRADGSSRFGVNDRFGYFPGAAVAWRISNESFMSGDFFNDLKLRASYGVTGNNNIGNFTSRTLFFGGTNYQDQPGIAPNQIGNPDLRWERTTQINFGLDYAILDSRLFGSFDYYIKTTDDLLFNRPIPTTSGYTSVTTNIGKVENRGFELAVTGRLLRGEVNWDIGVNAAYNRNEVLELFNDQPQDFGFATRLDVGQPIGSFYGYVTDGIFQNQAEIDAHSAPDGTPIQPNAAPGDYRFVDLNGDGRLTDSEDRAFIGQALPDWTGGVTTNFSWKGLTVDVFFQFSVGNDVYNNNNAFAEGLNSVFAPTVRSYEGAWRQEGDGDDFPRIVAGDPNNNRRDSDRFVEDGSFMRLKTATIAYNFPMDNVNFIRSLRVFVGGTNLITWTDYSWFDPEVSTFDTANVALGTDFLTYPQARTFTFGINLGL